MERVIPTDQGGAAAAPRAGSADQPSLLKLLSLQDFRRFVPETVGLLLAIVIVRGMLDAGLPQVFGAHDAFWIPVLLMAAQYGIMGGLFAACATSLLVLATEVPSESTAQDFYDYAAAAAAQPCAWFTAALVLGGLRTLHLHNQARVEDQLEETRAAAEELAHRLVGSAREMALLETRLAADTATVAVLLDGFARLDLSSAPALLASFAPIVRHAAGAESFAVFFREGPALVPRFGFENGSVVSGAALTMMSPAIPSGDDDAGLAGPAASGTAVCSPACQPVRLPIRIPIRAPHTTEPIAWLVCSRIAAAQSPAISARRLHEVCCVLARLLPVSCSIQPGAIRRPGEA